MRADVNVSLRRADGSFGDKVEVKNLNSFKSVEAALRFEIERQTRQLDDGFEVAQETRGWNEGGQKTVPQRGKEDAADYRYLPDPDLPRVQISRAWLERIEAASPETPERLRERLVEVGVKPADAQVLAADRDLAAVFEATLKAGDLEADQVALWCVNHVAALAAGDAAELPLTAVDGAGLARLLGRLNDGTLSNSSAKSLLAEALRGEDLDALIETRGLARLADAGAIDALIAGVVEAEPALVTAALENPKAVNALVGKTMQASRGSADPGVVRERVAAYLETHGGTT
jgi:aspartyl-tRNA(Asn)/glutamyl-tRNA(Gln) amidotransferase subunit B